MEFFILFAMAEVVSMRKFTSTGGHLSLRILEANIIGIHISKDSNLIVCLYLLCCVNDHHFYHVDNFR